jgi:hypothetical protein
VNNTVTYTIDFVAAIARLEAGTKQGAAAVKKMADDIESASNFARKALETIGIGLSAAAFVAGIKNASEAADAAARMGDRFGIATEKMIGMQHAADLSGVSHEALSNVLGGLAKNTFAAAEGNVKVAAAFTQLHINAREFIQLPMDQQLSIVIDRLNKVENAAIRNALAQLVLGKGAKEAMGLVADGSDAFKQAQADTEAWGLAINRIDAAKIDLARQAIKNAEAASRGMFTTISLILAPTIVELVNQFSDVAKKSHGFRDEISLLNDGLKFISVFAMAAQDIFYGLGHQIGGVGAAIAALFSGEFKSAYNIIEEVNADVLQHTIETNERIERVWAATTTSIDKAAKDLADRRKKMNEPGTSPKPLFDMQAGLYLKDVEKWSESLAFKRAVEDRYYAERLNAIAAFESQDTEFADRAQKVRERLARDHRDKLVAIARDEWENRALFAEFTNRDLMDVNQNLFGNLSQLMSSHSKSQFEIGKQAAIAQAIISTYSSAVKSYDALASIPYAGPYLGAAAAAAAIAAGLMNVANIRAQQFGGAGGGASATYSAIPGTTVPTGSLGPVTPPQTPVQVQAAPAPTQVHINFVGGTERAYSYDEICNEIIPLLNQAAGNGVVVTVSSSQ